MVKSVLRKTGVDVLVYPAHDASAQWLCSLKILRSDLQLTFSLEHIRSVSNEREIPYVTLRYEGDNLVPGSMSLKDLDINVSPGSLSKITRQGSPEFQTLFITLKQRCSVWYQEQDLNIDMNFRRLLTLARATQVCICFDTQWLAENAAMFQEIIQISQQFARLPPTTRFTQINTKASWSFLNFIPAAEPRARVSSEEPGSGIVSSIEDTGPEAPPFEDVEYDNPPPYVNVSYAQVSVKRSRRTDSSLTPDAHDPKRPRKHSCPSPETERVTLAPSLYAESTASSSATVAVDLFQEAVTSAVNKLLPHVLEKELLREELWKKKMTPVVMEVLPRVLKELLQTTSAGHDDSTHHPTLSTEVERAFTSVHESCVQELEETLDQRVNSASIELEEHSDEIRVDLATYKEDCIASCNDHLNEIKAGFDQGVVERVKDLENIANMVVLKAMDRLNEHFGHIGTQTVRKRGDVPIASEQSQRARSLPVPDGS